MEGTIPISNRITSNKATWPRKETLAKRLSTKTVTPSDSEDSLFRRSQDLRYPTRTIQIMLRRLTTTRAWTGTRVLISASSRGLRMVPPTERLSTGCKCMARLSPQRISRIRGKFKVYLISYIAICICLGQSTTLIMGPTASTQEVLEALAHTVFRMLPR